MLIFLLIMFLLCIIPVPVKLTFKYYGNKYYIYIYNKEIEVNKCVAAVKQRRTALFIKHHVRADLSHLIHVLKNNKFKPKLKLSAYITYGFDDAAVTGVFYGVIYSIYPIFIEIASKIFKIKGDKFCITPDFNNKTINLFIQSIISINLVKAIYMLVVISKNVLIINKNNILGLGVKK